MITKEQILNLTYRTELYHQHQRGSDGLPLRCRVNGKCITWKTRPEEFQLPVKHGLKQCFYISNFNAADWCLYEEDAMLHPLRKEGDWNKYLEKTGLRPTKFICSKCKKEKIIPSAKETCSVGYAVTIEGKFKEGELRCYECCAEIDKKQMIETGKITLYLSGKKHQNADSKVFAQDYYEISNWPGSLKFTAYLFKEGKHNIARKRFDVWFQGPDRYLWHGIQYGDNTQICHCKRTKVTKW